MGEQFIKKHTEQFRHQQDAAFEQELAARKLFSDMPEIYENEYTCRNQVSMRIEVGADVMVQLGAEGSIEVAQGQQVVGVINGSPAVELQAILKSDARAGGMMKARIVSLQRITGDFKIRCAE